jgi:hypothetical protein
MGEQRGEGRLVPIAREPQHLSTHSPCALPPSATSTDRAPRRGRRPPGPMPGARLRNPLSASARTICNMAVYAARRPPDHRRANFFRLIRRGAAYPCHSCEETCMPFETFSAPSRADRRDRRGHFRHGRRLAAGARATASR